MERVILQLKQQNKDLKEAEIEGLLYLLTQGSYENNELVTVTGLPKETLKQFKKSFNNYLSEGNDLIALNEEGKRLLSTIKLKPYLWTLLSFEDLDLLSKFKTYVEKFNLLPDRKYDQWLATAQTTVAKMLVLKNKGLIEDKSIALLGDDDLLSLCLILSNVKFAKLSVFDIDPRILKIVQELSKARGKKNIFTYEKDFKEDFSSNEVAQYDVVVTDPPYTFSGINLFLNRALELLKKENNYSGGYIFLYYGNSFKSPEKIHKIQRLIIDQGLLIEDKVDKFARYTGAESIGSASSLYILKSTPFSAQNISISTKSIYTADNLSEKKFPYVEHYDCKLFNVSQSVFSSKGFLLKAIGEFCKNHGLKVVKIDTTKFNPLGYSIMVSLSNSSLVLHTWEEFKAIHIDLITCSKVKNSDRILESLEKLFLAGTVEVKRLE